MNSKKFFIIDAMAMAFRSFHAFSQRPLTTSDGFPTSSLFGSISFLIKLIETEKPDYLVIASDSKHPNFRHNIYDAYKANRSEMPEDLQKQIPELFKLFEILGCPVLVRKGFEADDIIGSLVHQYAKDHINCYIVSGDKDFLQLINKNTFLYSPKKGGKVQITGEEGVFEKFQCAPNQVVDFLSLTGDSADNIPGVPGIGDKGAAKLISSYKTLDGIYENIELISNKRLKNALSENKKLAYLSKKLVTIKQDLETISCLEDAKFDHKSTLYNPELLDYCEHFEFKSLSQKIKNIQISKSDEQILSKKNSEEKKQTINQKKYILVDSEDLLNDCLASLRKESFFAFDTETTGLNIIDDIPIGISLSVSKDTAWYIPLNKEHQSNISKTHIINRLQDIFNSKTHTKVAHNAKFDLQMLNNIGIKVEEPFEDTMIMSFLIDPSSLHSLDFLSENYLNLTKIKTKELLSSTQKKSMTEVDIDLLNHYACEDADCCLQLYHILKKKLKEHNLEELYYTMELPLLTILKEMELSGIKINRQHLNDLSSRIGRSLEQLSHEIYELAEEEFNINSTKQLQSILYDKLKIHEVLNIKKIKKTKSGLSTDISVLQQLEEHPFVQKLLEYRSLNKLKNTYSDTLPLLSRPDTNRVHTSFNQTGTQTGRLSSSHPNLQNIPIRTTLGKEIRASFVASSDHVLISADYSQVELRILAHYSKDPVLTAAFKSSKDVHTIIASEILSIPESEVSKESRNQAKAINYGLIYGMGANRLAKTTGISVSEAKNFIEKYFQRFPSIKTTIDEFVSQAENFGYCETILGRQRPLPEIKSDNLRIVANARNIAINTPIQGSAADLIKIAMINIYKDLQASNLRCNMLLQIHDELVFECHVNDLHRVKNIIKTHMENAMTLEVPLVVDLGHGKNWLEAHS